MGIIQHAEREFKIKRWPGKCKMQALICKDVLALLKLFDSQGHSGSSAPYAVNLFERLARYKTLGPLTGKRYEWVKIDDNLWQNNRCSSVFKDRSHAWHGDAIVWRDKNGSCYTNKQSSVTISFPYEPKNTIKRDRS